MMTIDPKDIKSFRINPNSVEHMQIIENFDVDNMVMTMGGYAIPVVLNSRVEVGKIHVTAEIKVKALYRTVIGEFSFDIEI